MPGSDGYFDERIAASYDDDSSSFGPAVVEPAVDFLAGLVTDKRALEFGIGTGRIALPLAQRGIAVHGIDMSRPMLERLQAKLKDEDVSVTVGDFSDTEVEGSFSLVFLIFNTIMNLTTQEAQVACFKNAAAHLAPKGKFVIEVMVPQLQRLSHGQTLLAFDLSDEHWGIDEYDVVSQGLVSHHARIIDGDVQMFSAPFRYVWPAELDLMAQLAGMVLKERWAGWDRAPFVADSASHVSVWQKVD
ncbi:MAG: class I SAM-dependent methyltransferase [Pseudomonadales bacterium]|nr:class I SAM-dependent methyltransferase [Pseudomonadales bacterium]